MSGVVLSVHDPRRKKCVGAFTGIDWLEEAPETLEAAIKIILERGGPDSPEAGRALAELEPAVAYRLDLKACAIREIYLRRTPCWVYFAQLNDSNLVKIGRSVRVTERLAALGSQHAVTFNLIGTIRGDYQEERRLHFRFRKHRLRNLVGGAREIFFFDPIADEIDRIIEDGVVPSLLDREVA